MYKKITVAALVLALGMLLNSNYSYGQSTTSTTTNTQSTKQTVTTTPTYTKKAKAKPTPTVETTETVVTTTPATPRPAYDQATLKKMNDTLCVDGFDAKVGNDKKNVCSGVANTPDIAYSCIWTKKGESAFASTRQGPCNLDNSEHRGNIVITKADYKSSPPLPYGTKVECCYRAAKGAPTTSTTSSTTTAPVKK